MSYTLLLDGLMCRQRRSNPKPGPKRPGFRIPPSIPGPAEQPHAQSGNTRAVEPGTKRREVTMRHMVLTGRETHAELLAMIAELRICQRKAVIPSTAAEYAADVDELLDLLPRPWITVAP